MTYLLAYLASSAVWFAAGWFSRGWRERSRWRPIDLYPGYSHLPPDNPR